MSGYPGMSHPRGMDFRRSAASPSLSPGRGPLPPPRDRVSAGMTRLAYVLMHDKKGWSSLAHQAQYLRTQPPGVSDVDVEKGTLVEVDPDGDFDPRTNISVNVVSLDHPEVRVSLLMKELLPIEEGVFQRLIPLRPSERYSVMTDDRRGRMLAAGVGDTVYCVTSSRYKEVGMVQYVGPLRGVKGGGIFYGVELLDSRYGDTDGRYGSHQYFTAAPNSSLFVTVAQLYFYDDRQPRQPLRRPNSLVTADHSNQIDGDGSTALDRLMIVEGSNYVDRPPSSTALRSRRRDEEMHPIHAYGKADDGRNGLEDLRRIGSRTGGSVGLQLSVGDRVVWLPDEGGQEYGFVRWMGSGVEEGPLAGIEFDNRVGSGNGVYQGRRLFKTKPGHASLIPLDGLLKAEDYEGDSLRQGDGNERGRDSGSSSSRVEGRRKARQRQQQQQPDRPQSHLKHTNMERRLPTLPNPEGAEVDYNVNGESDGGSSEEGGVDENVAYHNRLPPQQSLRGGTGDEATVAYDDRARLIEKMTLADKAVITCNLKDKRRPPTPPKSPSSSRSPSPPPAPAPPPIFDRLDPSDTSSNHKELEVGSLVELRRLGLSCYGVVRWVGWLPEHDRTGVGVEMEEELPGASNGWHKGSQLFGCAEGRAVFVPFTHVRPDARFREKKKGGRKNRDANGNDGGEEGEDDFGGLDCPAVTGFHRPIKVSSVDNLVAKVVGRNKGIQGHQNSCYLDATLFAMFSFTSVFDSLLYRPPSPEDITEYTEVQRVLREEVVNPLRKNLFVRADKVMRLRKLLDSLTSVKGLMSEEKDPEEFLNSLLTQTLRATPFLELSSGQTAHLYQLFVEKKEGVTMPTVQDLFEQSFRTSEVKLRKVPSVLILQMPRFGRQYKVYDRIIPSQILDVTDVIEDSPRQCIICGKLADVECLECFGTHGSGLDNTAYCAACIEPVHAHQKRKNHRISRITVPEEFLSNRSSDSAISRLYMELFAVVCIETSHYVAFVKSGLGPDAPWCFFDSMADRKGEASGYNIPEVTEANDVAHWLSEEGSCSIRSQTETKSLPVHAKRLICDGYMCFYQSPQVMMYQ